MYDEEGTIVGLALLLLNCIHAKQIESTLVAQNVVIHTSRLAIELALREDLFT